ncbi:uncharacterized protein LOC122044029 [Zingiber officinale]|uniref:uncharacterized protein LOC122044029 n=1 Tax=Zingiber officinale TaxID=94328 RepID=UPI001C4D0D37|nr:uncharacterized protein LOC122044029 [Zingiber officinale]
MTCCMELVAAVLVGTQKKIVTAENSVWDEYIKTHGDVEQFRYKSLAYYEELSIIFGGDRSSGKDAQVPADIVEELDKVAVENDESIGVDGDYASYVQDFIFESSEENSKPKRRKTESTKDLSRVIREAIAILGEELNNAKNELSIDVVLAREIPSMYSYLQEFVGSHKFDVLKEYLDDVPWVYIGDNFVSPMVLAFDSLVK